MPETSCEPVDKVDVDGEEPGGRVRLRVPPYALWGRDTRITAVQADPDGVTLLEYGFEDHSADGTTVAQTARGEWAGVSVTLAETGNHNLTALAAEAGLYGLPFIDVRLRRPLTGAQAEWRGPLRQAVEATGARQETGSSSGRHKSG